MSDDIHQIRVAELKGRIAAFKEKYSYLYPDNVDKTDRPKSSDTVRPSTPLQSSNAEALKASLRGLQKR